jgi:hypothetical protein
MKDLSEFDDVLAKDVQVEETQNYEFEFEDGLWCIKRERNHYEICFESEEGEEGMVVEQEDFENGIFGFEIDGTEHELLLADFDRINKFYHEKCVQ